MPDRIPERAGAVTRQVALLCCASALALAGAGALAGEPDKIVTDRPDFVESSDVVGRGRVQIETSVALERLREDGGRERTRSTPSLLRVGLGDSLEARLETDGRMVTRSEQGGIGLRQAGYADLALGLKWHVLDAAAGAPSLGLLLHADLDTGSPAFRGQGVRPSLRLVAEWALPGELALGVMPGLAWENNEAGERYLSGIAGVVLGKTWTPRWRSFVELSAPRIARAADGGSLLSVDMGAAYLLSDSWQVDTAVSRGLRRTTPDWSWTVGVSAKF
ncbi:MAG: transporter [Pseudomonadota bacterium]